MLLSVWIKSIHFRLSSHDAPVLQNEVHDLRHNSSGTTVSPHHKMYGETYGAEGLQEPFTPVQSYHGAPLTGQYDTRI